MGSKPPVIGFELGVGEFRIVTPEAVYQIRVLPELVTANTNLGVISPRIGSNGGSAAQAPAPSGKAPEGPGEAGQAPEGPADTGFFQEISEELFEKVGQLARQLSISVGEIPEVEENDLSKTGHALEDAKGQLEEVVELTERASMTIMDLADQIQADMDSLNRQMAALSSLESLLGAAPEAPKGGGEDFRAKLEELRAAAEALPDEAPGPGPLLAAPSAPPAPPAPPEPVIVFSLSTVFQTLYEFCTNESVKDHIKAMIQGLGEGAFNAEAVEAEMSQQAKTLPPDDGFYNYPIPALLKSLYANTQNDEFRTTLKKMNQTASSIFLDSTLMIEGTEEAPAPEAPKAEEVVVEVEANDAPEVGPGVESPAREVKRLVEELSSMPLPAASAENASAGDLASIPTADRETILKTVSASDALVKSTSKHLTQIMEALSFQDLSGQRIKKIVSLIGEIQVQLLTMLVSVNTKIKAHHESPAAPRPKEETEKVAQAEVDKMLERLSADPSELKGPGAEGRLDQGAVNDLLAQLGF